VSKFVSYTKEEHKLEFFDNWVFMKIFGHKTDERTGGCRKLRNEELHGFYSLTNIRVIRQRLRGVDGTVILHRILKKGDVMTWT
jgi:hypothetical protein